MPETLAQRVRAKYPGAYDDMSDEQLESSVVAKFPGVYDDMPRTKKAAPAPQSSVVGDLAGGLRSSAARTVYGGGDLIRRGYNALVPESLEVERVINRPQVQAAMKAPESTAGTIGSAGGDIAQMFLPTGAPARFKKAAEVVKAGALTLAQTGSPGAAATSAGITALVPGAATVTRASDALRSGAEKTVAQALGPTKEWAKDTAAKIAPGMLRRSVGGSRAAMLEQATAKTAAVGQQIGAEIQAAAQAGVRISGDSIRSVIQQSKVGLMVENANGALIPIEGTQRVLRKLGKLDDFVAQLGPDIPIDRAAKIKTTYDRIVSKAGLYGQKAGASATDSADAWAVREASGAFRELIARGSATIDDLNHEYAFWKGLKGVLTETEKRTQAQSGGLTAAITGAAGMGAGAVSGDSASDRVQNAIIGGLAGRQLVRAMQSPWWRTQASGPLKEKLADALASGSSGQIIGAVGKISAAIPAQTSPRPTLR